MNAFLYTTDVTLLAEGSNTLVLDVPRGLDNKSHVLSWYSNALSFPGYFGFNWDAFDECLRDLSWIEERKIIIRHDDVPLGESPPDQKIYIKVLARVAREWKSYDAREVIVVFPPAYEPALKILTR